jgi:hypothetical protein
VLCVGCKPVEPAPEDLDGLSHYIWQHVDEGEDALIVEAVSNLQLVMGDVSADNILEGELTTLSAEEVAHLEVDQDPASAAGVLLADSVSCTGLQLEAVLAYEHQEELYVGVYETYEREMTSSPEDFHAGISDWLSWDLDYRTSLLGVSYNVRSRSILRRVHGLESGPILIGRTHLPEPAVFDNENANSFLTQDYHLSIYWPHPEQDGVMMHMYALWKDTSMLGFEDEGEATQRIILNNLADWDDGTSQLCEAGLPAK